MKEIHSSNFSHAACVIRTNVFHRMMVAALELVPPGNDSAHPSGSKAALFARAGAAWLLFAPLGFAAEPAEKLSAACDRVVAEGKLHPKCVEISHPGSCKLLERLGRWDPACVAKSTQPNSRGPSPARIPSNARGPTNEELADRIVGPRPQRQAAAPAPSVSPIQGLNEMPSVERVMQEIKGADPLETAARQSAAFWQLEDMIQVLSDGRYFRRQLSPDEESIIKSYKSANGAIHREIGKHFPEGSPKSGPDSPSLKWMNRTSRLQGDKGFQTELLDKFFSPAWKTRFQLAQVNQNQRIAVQQAELARATQGPARAGSAVWGDGKRNEQPGAAEINAIPEVLAAFGQMAANTQRNTYAEACKKRKLEVKGTPLKGLYVSASGAWLDFSCGAADLCGESAPFYEYEVKGNQVLVGRFQLTRTPDGNLSGPRVITVTVDRAAARVNFQTVYQSVQKECPIGTLRKSDKSSPYD